MLGLLQVKRKIKCKLAENETWNQLRQRIVNIVQGVTFPIMP